VASRTKSLDFITELLTTESVSEHPLKSVAGQKLRQERYTTLISFADVKRIFQTTVTLSL
jgi:hypothetical protein